jgi:hypothetical protein
MYGCPIVNVWMSYSECMKLLSVLPVSQILLLTLGPNPLPIGIVRSCSRLHLYK